MRLSDLPREAAKFRTITVDIFDTVLIRKVYPEDVQFLEHAALVKNLLDERFGITTDAYYLYKMRKYVRSVVDDVKERRGYDREATISEIFGGVLGAIVRRFGLELLPAQKKTLIEEMIALELELEKRYLRPNLRLIELLRRCREHGLRIYYLSDVYLSAKHVNALLEHFGVLDVFDGGFTSADQGCSKHSGKLYKRLYTKLIKDFDHVTNVHLGDNRHSDYCVPRQFGITVVHYRTFHHAVTRRIQWRFNAFRLRLRNWAYKRATRRALRAVMRHETASLNRQQHVLFGIGFKVGPALVNYAAYLGTYAGVMNAPVFLLSSEGNSIGRLLARLGFRLKTRQLARLNRITALRAFAYRSIKDEKIDLTRELLSLFQAGEGKDRHEHLLASWGLDKQALGLSSLTLNITDGSGLIERVAVSDDVRAMVLRKLRRSYGRLVRQLAATRLFWADEAILADVGWNATIQTLVGQILQLRGGRTRLEGIYLGCTGSNVYDLQGEMPIKGVLFNKRDDSDARALLVEEIWEFILSYQHEREERQSGGIAGAIARLAHRFNGRVENPDAEKNHTIWKGIGRFLDVYMDELQIDPVTLYCVGRPDLLRLFARPSREEALMLGSVTHEAGFGSKVARTIIDLSYTRERVLRISLLRPAKLLSLLREQYWPAGFIRWYNLGYIRPFLTLGRLLRRLILPRRQ